jgi:hypothetical protein
VGQYATDEDREAFTTALASDTEEADAQASEAPVEPDTPDEDADGDEQESTEGEPEETPDPAAETEPMFTVRVDGRDVEVPQSELIKGYQRQADYSRKTTLLATQRRQLADAEALMQALERNPAETLKVIARHYEVEGYADKEQPFQASPEAEALRELQQWRAAQEQRQIEMDASQREAAVDAELERLHREYGEFEDEDLFGYAVERGIRDLEAALRAMTYGRNGHGRTEKRKVAAMSGGQGHSPVAKPKTDPVEVVTFQDAYEAAKRELRDTA